MKNLTDFRKMVETGVDPCLYFVVFIQDYTQESCLLRPFGNPYFSLKWEFIGSSCIGSNRVKPCPQLRNCLSLGSLQKQTFLLAHPHWGTFCEEERL